MVSSNPAGYREMKSTVIEWFDLKHVLNEIGEREKIIKFLETLGIDHPNIRTAETTPKEFILQAVGILQAWNSECHSINPVIILSSTLEKLNHDSANNFFIVTDDKKQGLKENEWESDIRALSRKHVVMLSTIVQKVRGNTKPIHSMQILKENCEVLFNTENMLRDWWEEQLCSYYRRRCKLDDTITVLMVHSHDSVQTNATKDTTSANSQSYTVTDQWPSNYELELIADHIDDKYTEHIRERLELTNLSQNSKGNDVFDALCAWRQSMEEDFPTTYRKLIYALKDTNVSGLLSPMRMDDIHKAEYVEIAFNLLMTDILPVVKHLGINETKLTSYRPAFEPSHLQEGTVGLVSTLITSLDKNKQREVLCKRLKEIGFPPNIQLKFVVYQMSLGELLSIFNALKTSEMNAEEEGNTPQQEPKEGDHLLPSKQATPSELPKSSLGSKFKKFTESRKVRNIQPYTTSNDRPSTTQDQSKPEEVDAFLVGMEDKATPMEQNAREAEDPSPKTKNPVTSDAVTITMEKEDAEPAEPPASSEDKFSSTPMDAKDPEVSKSEHHSPHLSQIKKILNLTDELVSSLGEDNLDEFTLFRIWKEKIQFSALNERAAVIKCLQDSGETDIARSVIEGKFIPDEISLPFIKHIVKKAKANSQLEKLAEVLGLKRDYQESQGSLDDMSEIIQKEFRWNRSQKIQKIESKVSNKSTEDRDVSILMEQVRNLNLHAVSQADKLVEHGFLGLACELLIIYHF